MTTKTLTSFLGKSGTDPEFASALAELGFGKPLSVKRGGSRVFFRFTPEAARTIISITRIMKPKDFLRLMILIVALSALGISSGVASDKNEAKHSGKITKAKAERIALTKVPGGSIRSAELEAARGQRFWSRLYREA